MTKAKEIINGNGNKNENENGNGRTVDGWLAGNSHPPLEEGVAYTATLLTVEKVEGKTPESSFIKFLYELEDGRRVVDTRFPAGLNVFEREIRQQLDIEGVVSVKELLEHMQNNSFNVWFTFPTVEKQNGSKGVVRNMHYIKPPLPEKESDTPF